MTNTMDQWVRVVDHASMMTDRWLFLASLIASGTFGVLVIRWLTKRTERQTATLISMIATSQSQSVEFAKVVQQNTDVMNETRKLLGKMEDQIARCARAQPGV